MYQIVSGTAGTSGAAGASAGLSPGTYYVSACIADSNGQCAVQLSVPSLNALIVSGTAGTPGAAGASATNPSGTTTQSSLLNPVIDESESLSLLNPIDFTRSTNQPVSVVIHGTNFGNTGTGSSIDVSVNGGGFGNVPFGTSNNYYELLSWSDTQIVALIKGPMTNLWSGLVTLRLKVRTNDGRISNTLTRTINIRDVSCPAYSASLSLPSQVNAGSSGTATVTVTGQRPSGNFIISLRGAATADQNVDLSTWGSTACSSTYNVPFTAGSSTGTVNVVLNFLGTNIGSAQLNVAGSTPSGGTTTSTTANSPAITSISIAGQNSPATITKGNSVIFQLYGQNLGSFVSGAALDLLSADGSVLAHYVSSFPNTFEFQIWNSGYIQLFVGSSVTSSWQRGSMTWRVRVTTSDGRVSNVYPITFNVQ